MNFAGSVAFMTGMLFTFMAFLLSGLWLIDTLKF